MATKQELLETQRKLQALFPQVREELLKIPGVLKVTIGIKEKEKRLTGEVVFRVYVEEKKPLDQIPPEQRVPKTIRGVNTDVLVVRKPVNEDDTSKYRPVKGGIQVNANGSGMVGTMGCLAQLTSDDSFVILSNHHVLYDGSAVDGTEIGQPNYVSSLCCTCNDIAANVHGIHHDHLDCAIARLKSGVSHDARIEEIGFITGVGEAVVGHAVKKRGRTTGLTTGEVSDITFGADGVTILEIEVKTDDGDTRFSRGGDSGSALLNEDDEIVGLHKAGNNGDDVAAGDFYSISIGIQEVLDALSADGFEIEILTGVGGDESASLFAPGMVPLAMVTPDQVYWTIEQRLRLSPAGREVWRLVETHQEEILHLVNHERHVTVAWHRKQGPTYMAAMARSVKEPGYRLPLEIEGVSRQSMLMSMLTVLEEYGSPSLKAAIQQVSLPLMQASGQAETFDEIVNALERMAVLASAEF